MSATAPITALIGLGANLGDPLQALREARQALAAIPASRLTAVSPLYRTAPVGGPAGQPDYLNAVLQLETRLSAGELLALCRQLEERCGRRRGLRWAARTLDLDLLDYGRQLLRTPALTLPHPRLHLRRFVLAPLADVAPDWRHPRLGRSARQLLAALPAGEAVQRLEESW